MKPDWPSQFDFRDGGLVGWRIMYSVRYRSIMLAALKDKYGGPSKDSLATFFIWKEPQAQVSMSLDHEFDSVHVVSLDEMRRRKTEQADRASKAAKGL